MEIITDQNNRCITPTGRIDANTSLDLDLALEQMPLDGRDIVIDLSGCHYVSSAGIRILLKARKRLMPSGNGLCLAGVHPEVRQVLETAGLLQFFSLVPNIATAQARIRAAGKKRTSGSSFVVGGRSFEYRPLATEATACTLSFSPEILSYRDLGVAAGFGVLSGPATPDTAFSDFFITLGHCCGFIPVSQLTGADFRITSDPEKTGFAVSEAVSFGAGPTGIIKPSVPGRVPFDVLHELAMQIAHSDGIEHPLVMLVTLNRDREHPSLIVALVNSQALMDAAVGNGMDLFRVLMSGKPGRRNVASPSPEGTAEDGSDGTRRFAGITFHLADNGFQDREPGFGEFAASHLNYENIVSVGPLYPTVDPEDPLIWIFMAGGCQDGRETRLQIEHRPDFVFEPAKAFLARLLYKDSARIVVDKLHGGYSAQTYHVTSFDPEGRKMRPTVMKVAHRDLIARETERCQKYALPYIFNNCAVVLGAEHWGDLMALRYNFVGIGGEASQLKWLTHYYLGEDIAFLEPLFDKVFLQILKPWYGQPVPKIIQPFRDHDPTFTFFAHIYKTVADLFAVTPDEPGIFVEEAGRKMTNPYWFLKHEYARLREWSTGYFAGICHGDLNMQNILIDEKMNVYLIDFSETRPRSVVSDFARLEAIFLVDNAPVENEEDMAAYLEFIEGFYACPSLAETPRIVYHGRHTVTVEKNARLALKMRRYAFESALNNDDLLPYLIALLEWVLPIVCYTSLPYNNKRLAMIAASVLCGLVGERVKRDG